MEKGDHSSIIYGTHFPNRLFVGCLPPMATADDLGKFFTNYGKVVEAKVVLDERGNSKRFGFISFSTNEEAEGVLKAGPIHVMGKKINVGPAVKKEVKDSIPQVPVKIVTSTPVEETSPGVDTYTSTQMPQRKPKYTYQINDHGRDSTRNAPPRSHNTSSSRLHNMSGHSNSSSSSCSGGSECGSAAELMFNHHNISFLTPHNSPLKTGMHGVPPATGAAQPNRRPTPSNAILASQLEASPPMRSRGLPMNSPNLSPIYCHPSQQEAYASHIHQPLVQQLHSRPTSPPVPQSIMGITGQPGQRQHTSPQTTHAPLERASPNHLMDHQMKNNTGYMMHVPTSAVPVTQQQPIQQQYQNQHLAYSYAQQQQQGQQYTTTSPPTTWPVQYPPHQSYSNTLLTTVPQQHQQPHQRSVHSSPTQTPPPSPPMPSPAAATTTINYPVTIPQYQQMVPAATQQNLVTQLQQQHLHHAVYPSYVPWSSDFEVAPQSPAYSIQSQYSVPSTPNFALPHPYVFAF